MKTEQMNKLFDIKALQQYFLDQVWNKALDEMPLLQQRLIIALRITHLIIRDLMDGMITLRAMELVYTTILALVPLLAVSFSVLKGFGVHNQIEPMLLNLLQPLGEKGVEITDKIIGFVDNTRAGVLGSLGLALLMYTVVSLLQKIERAFNYTWRVTQHRRIVQRFSDYLVIILIGPVLLFSALGMTASVSSMSMIQRAMEIEAISSVIKLVAHLIPYLLVIGAFTFIYILVPNIKVKFRSALMGGVVAGVLWETTSWLFAVFVVNSTKYTAIYSAFATMIIFFIWLYMNWLILLIGCSIASYHQQPSQRTLRSRIVRMSNRMREYLALMIMLLVARHYHLRKDAWTVETLSEKLNVDTNVCEMLVNRLVDVGLLLAGTGEIAAYVPAYDYSNMKLSEIVLALRQSGEDDHLSLANMSHEDVVDEIYSKIESGITTSLADQTLYDLVKSETR